MLTDADLARIAAENDQRRELAAKATPGPWCGEFSLTDWRQDEHTFTMEFIDNRYVSKEQRNADLAFMAHARNSDPSGTINLLLAEVAELRLLLRDAVLGGEPGARLWAEGVKAGLEAALWTLVHANALAVPAEACNIVQRIDPATIFPPT